MMHDYNKNLYENMRGEQSIQILYFQKSTIMQKFYITNKIFYYLKECKCYQQIVLLGINVLHLNGSSVLML